MHVEIHGFLLQRLAINRNYSSTSAARPNMLSPHAVRTSVAAIGNAHVVLNPPLNYDHIVRRTTTAERSLSFTRPTPGSRASSMQIAKTNRLCYPVRKPPWNTTL